MGISGVPSAIGTADDLGLLLLHALPLDGRMWAQQMHILPNATHAPNLYAFGDDLSKWAQRCVDLVPAKRMVVVGCSVGGSCALEVLNLVPERVAAIILIGTKARHDPDPDFAAQAVKTVEDEGTQAAWRQYWEPLFGPAQTNLARDAAATIAQAQSKRDLIAGLTAFHNRKSRDDVVAGSRSPVHIVSGDSDTLPGVDYARQLASLNDLCTLHVIKDCGHYAPLMQPGAVTLLIKTVVADCLQSHGSSARG